MAKIGYIYITPHCQTLDDDRRWMLDYGCVRVVEEEFRNEKTRPEWQQLLASLGRGDEIVVSRFSNALRGTREMSVFFELCRIQQVRIISIQDRIDTTKEGNSLFPDTTVSAVIDMFGSLPAEILAMRKADEHVRHLKDSPRPKTPAAISRQKREQMIVKMYNNGHTVDAIWKASGFRSRSSIFRILNKFGDQITRKRNGQ